MSEVDLTHKQAQHFDNPVIPFIEGDGIGVDITPAMLKVVDAAVQKTYLGFRKITWQEELAGEKTLSAYGSHKKK